MKANKVMKEGECFHKQNIFLYIPANGLLIVQHTINTEFQ